MSTKTGIEWTDATWNPIRGCTRVSEGCRNCYAEKVAYRFKREGDPFEGLVEMKNGHASWTGKIQFVEEHLLDPLKWKRPRRIFVNSMSDLFHENVTDEILCAVFKVMCEAKRHTFQVLTKRPARMLDFISRLNSKTRDFGPLWPNTWPQRHIWLGVSVENQAAADERIPLLLQTPAAVRFISAEPLLGPVSLRWKDSVGFGNAHPRHLHPVADANGRVVTDEYDGLRELDWVICGGESGTGARPMHPDWARALRDQCSAAGVPFFFKQWGEWLPDAGWEAGRTNYAQFARVGKKAAGALLDGVEWKQFPEVR